MAQNVTFGQFERYGTRILVTAPAILVMKFVGDEGALGLIQGISGAITAIMVYVLGRIARPQDRKWIFFGSVWVFLSEHWLMVSCFRQ